MTTPSARPSTAALATGTPPAIVSIHSFTPVWRGRGRPWQAGILWDADPGWRSR